MITSFDDYPIHQSELPVAHTASGDPNHYDRYFFNGWSRDGSTFFAAAMGLYPNRHVMDASFSVIRGDEQVNVHASTRSDPDRARCTRVGPVSVEILEPMRRHRVVVNAPEHGLRADLVFTAASQPFEEPVFDVRSGVRQTMRLTRFTQAGRWEGWIEVDGLREVLEPSSTRGCRDRSWGVRNVGERVTLGAPQVSPPQFFWLWAPVCFDGFATLFDVNEDAQGHRWHAAGAMLEGMDEPRSTGAIDYSLEWEPGTRHMKNFTARYEFGDGRRTLHFEPVRHFQMLGLGYGHPEWGHGMWKGEDALGGERFALPVIDPMAPHHLHVQTLSRVTLEGPDGIHTGSGILETLVVGAHAPSGFTDLFDPAR